MKQRNRAGRIALSTLFVCAILALPVSAVAASASEKSTGGEAEEILRSMTAYLGSLAAFTAEAEIDNEVLSTSGEKIHLTSSGDIALERPDKLYMSRHGGIANVEWFYDGTQVTVHGKNLGVYYQLDVPGGIDAALNATRLETGLGIPGADLLYSDAYEGLMTGVVSSEYRGIGVVDGDECHHLAFRTPSHDWQIWIRTGDEPLPMMYVIINKWVTAAPQYTLRLDDWETKTDLDDDDFVFTPGAEARKLDSLPVDETGEIVLEELK